MKVLLGALSWGLGHATRDLPVLKKMIDEGHEVTVLSYGRSLELLKHTLKDRCEYKELFDYPLPYTKSNLMPGKIMLYFPRILKAIKDEHRKAQKIIHQGNFDRVISDARYGVYSLKKPSFFMTNQVKYISPGRFFLGELATEFFNHNFHKKFSAVIVPDYRDNSLSGDLSHNLKFLKDKRIEYVGMLTDLQKKEVKQDIDHFITISGPEPQRTLFQEKIFKQIDQLKGRIVVTCGKPESINKDLLGDVEVHTHLKREDQEDFTNRSKMVIARSGYTTMMELVALGKKALLVPTPGQTEQEYLSKYHNKLGTFYSVSQNKFQLGRDAKIAEKYSGFNEQHDTKKSVDKFMQIIS